jgi:hypothetical protein
MIASRSITNNPLEFCVEELSQLLGTPGRGPFMVTQRGSAPDDPQKRECVFVLTRRGTWLHFYLFIALPEHVRRRIAMLDTVEQTLERCARLPSKVTVEDAHSLPELLADVGFEPHESDLSGRALFEHMRKLRTEATVMV